MCWTGDHIESIFLLIDCRSTVAKSEPKVQWGENKPADNCRSAVAPNIKKSLKSGWPVYKSCGWKWSTVGRCRNSAQLPAIYE